MNLHVHAARPPPRTSARRRVPPPRPRGGDAARRRSAAPAAAASSIELADPLPGVPDDATPSAATGNVYPVSVFDTTPGRSTIATLLPGAFVELLGAPRGGALGAGVRAHAPRGPRRGVRRVAGPHPRAVEATGTRAARWVSGAWPGGPPSDWRRALRPGVGGARIDPCGDPLRSGRCWRGSRCSRCCSGAGRGRRRRRRRRAATTPILAEVDLGLVPSTAATPTTVTLANPFDGSATMTLLDVSGPIARGGRRRPAKVVASGTVVPLELPCSIPAGAERAGGRVGHLPRDADRGAVRRRGRSSIT